MNLAEHIRPQLELLAPQGTLWVGFSGGLDSAVLLHVLTQQPELKPRIKAIHVHHGLSNNADAWLNHCQQQCEQWQVPFYVEKVQLSDIKDGVEQAARSARYQVFKQHCQAGDVLLLAQHADDQLETFFMRLLRGAGLSGLTGMAVQRNLATNIKLIRPLLAISRAQLEQYAQAQQLVWVEDESNQDSTFERNWWRNELLPIIWQKFPQRKTAVLRSIEQLQQDQRLLAEFLQPEVDQVCSPWPWPNCLPVALDLIQLESFPEHHWPYLVRGWLQLNGLMQPSKQWLTQFFIDVMQAKEDASPLLALAGWQVARHKQWAFLTNVGSDTTNKKVTVKTLEQTILIKSQQNYTWLNGCIRVKNNLYGLPAGKYVVTTASCVRGQTLKAKGRPSKTVKAWLQQENIPAVLRKSWPVLLMQTTAQPIEQYELVAIVGVAQAEHKLVQHGLVLDYLKK